MQLVASALTSGLFLVSTSTTTTVVARKLPFSFSALSSLQRLALSPQLRQQQQRIQQFSALKMSTTAATSGDDSSLKLRVVSYNVLSSHLADPDHFPSLNPDHLEAAARLPVVLEKLEKELVRPDLSSSSSNNNETTNHRPVIICLQEVSYDWAGPLHTFFANKGYHMVSGLYGKNFNGYMGVCLAWPTSQFETLSVDVSRLSDTYPNWPRPPPPPKPEETVEADEASTSTTRKITTMVTRLPLKVMDYTTNQIIKKRIVEPMAGTVWSSFTSLMKLNVVQTITKTILPESSLMLLQQQIEAATAEPPTDHWWVSESRFNVMLTATLKDKTSQKSFCVATYHMPCAFYAPKIMTIHVDLAAKHIQTVAAKELQKLKQQQQGTTTTTAINDDDNDKNENKPFESLPYILAGDFNIKPTDSMYHFLLSAQMDESDPNYPTPKLFPNQPPPNDINNNNHWKPLIREPLKSAYAEAAAATGAGAGQLLEPDFTNYARVGDQEPFIDTLDYIFLSSSQQQNQQQWKVDSVLPLPHRTDAQGPFPNLDVGEPSDHILIAADVSLV